MRSRQKQVFFAVVMTLGGLASIQSAAGQSVPYPPYGAWRGRIVSRDGHGRYIKYRWGNGLTPTGGAVLSTGIEAFAPIVSQLVTGPRDVETRDATTRGSNFPDDYIVEQRRANDLLAKTAYLVGYQPTEDPPKDEQSHTLSPSLDPREYLKSNPWGSSTGGAGDVAPRLNPRDYSETNPWDSPKGN